MTWKASRILKMWLDVHGKLIKLVYQKKVYEEAKLTTCTKDDCTGAQVYGRQSRHICETLFGKSTLLQEKKKETIRTYFSHSKGSKTWFTTPSHSSYLPALPLSFWKVRARQKHMTDSQEWQHIRNSFDVQMFGPILHHMPPPYSLQKVTVTADNGSISQWDYWKKLYQKND